MNYRVWIVLAGMGLCGVVATFGCAGCTDDQIAEMQRFDRSYKHPEDYNDMPLGPQFDTRTEINQLLDDQLRQHMNLWMDIRDEYLRAWRHDDTGAETKRLENRRATLKAVIQYRYSQLAGRPLVRGG